MMPPAQLHPDARVRPRSAPCRAPRQLRSAETRRRITEAAIQVIADHGIGGLTHRRVAAAAGVPLAATTYYFAGKDDIIDAAASQLLTGYLRGFQQLAAGLRAPAPSGFDALIRRIAVSAAGRQRAGSIAWGEILLAAARDNDSRSIARNWFAAMAASWREIAEALQLRDPDRRAQSGLDLAAGLVLLTTALALSPAQIRDTLDGKPLPAPAGPGQPPAASAPPPPASRKSDTTREQILSAALDLLAHDGPAGVTYRSVAARTGLTVSAPAYHFGSIGQLLSEAQMRMFTAAKARYRAGLDGPGRAPADADRLADLSATILQREATEQGAANVAVLSLWLEAARTPAVRPTLHSGIADQTAAWTRHLRRIAPAVGAREGLLLQSLYLGRLLRLVATGARTADLVAVRAAFRAEIAALTLPAHAQRQSSTLFENN